MQIHHVSKICVTCFHFRTNAIYSSTSIESFQAYKLIPSQNSSKSIRYKIIDIRYINNYQTTSCIYNINMLILADSNILHSGAHFQNQQCRLWRVFGTSLNKSLETHGQNLKVIYLHNFIFVLNLNQCNIKYITCVPSPSLCQLGFEEMGYFM